MNTIWHSSYGRARARLRRRYGLVPVLILSTTSVRAWCVTANALLLNVLIALRWNNTVQTNRRDGIRSTAAETNKTVKRIDARDVKRGKRQIQRERARAAFRGNHSAGRPFHND